MTDLDSNFNNNSVISHQIIEGVARLPHVHCPNKITHSYSVCKLAATHLVCLSLQVRKRVGDFLRVKKKWRWCLCLGVKSLSLTSIR